MDTIWLLYTCLILTNRIMDTPINIEYLANKIKLEIITTNSCYPSCDLGKSSKSLNLEQFLASHEIGSNIHWTTHSPTSKLLYQIAVVGKGGFWNSGMVEFAPPHLMWRGKIIPPSTQGLLKGPIGLFQDFRALGTPPPSKLTI